MTSESFRTMSKIGQGLGRPLYLGPAGVICVSRGRKPAVGELSSNAELGFSRRHCKLSCSMTILYERP